MTRPVILRRYETRVEFHQVDSLRVVHNAQYLLWFERGRLELLEEVFPMRRLSTLTLATPVVENRCLYLAPAVYGDELLVTTRHRLLDRYEGRFAFEHDIVNRRTKVELARGETVVAVLDLERQALVKEIPAEIWQRYLALPSRT